MEFDNCLATNKHQGNVGEARAIYEYTKLGFTVLKPLIENGKYDFVIDTPDCGLLRVQVKTTRQEMSPGRWQVGIKTTGGNRKINTITNRKAGDYDVLFVLANDGQCWHIPESALGNVCSSVSVGGKKYEQYRIG
jgi:hypothetical protein